jgi:limonene 1,2-monooxygenase
MPARWPLRFGAFFAPFHPVGQSPTLALDYDLDRVVELDRLGYDEAWFGEHHSGGYEIIGCPEIFIAAAAERTKRIKLGTGVVSLPYHHPWLLADRISLLDHLTKGRLIFGCGPGALPTDAHVMGIDPVDQRRMMEESLEAILALFTADGPIDRETDWFTIRDGWLQLKPYTHPHPEVAVAAMVTPSGPRLAGQHNVSLLSLSMSLAEGFAAIGQAWGVVEEMAEKHGRPTPDRRTWRILGNMHIAETREQAVQDCTYGLRDFSDYFGGGAGFVPLANKVEGEADTEEAFVERYNTAGGVVIGTPDDAIEYIEGLLEQSGGFGTFLLLGHDWASPERTMQSYRLIAEKVIPHFQGQLASPRASHEWATENRNKLFGRSIKAMGNAIQQHVDEKEKDAAEAGTLAGDGEVTA